MIHLLALFFILLSRRLNHANHSWKCRRISPANILWHCWRFISFSKQKISLWFVNDKRGICRNMKFKAEIGRIPKRSDDLYKCTTVIGAWFLQNKQHICTWLNLRGIPNHPLYPDFLRIYIRIFFFSFLIHCFKFLKLGTDGGLLSINAHCFQRIHVSVALLVNRQQQHDCPNSRHDAPERYRSKTLTKQEHYAWFLEHAAWSKHRAVCVDLWSMAYLL